MSRAISASAKSALFASRTDKCFLALLTITHVNLTAPIRVVNNGENITSNGNDYQWFPFDIEIPADSIDEIPKIRITISDPTRKIAPQIRALTTSPEVSLSIIMSDTPNTVEVGPFVMTLKNVSWDELTISGELGYEDIFEEPYPGDTFTPAEYPGLF